MHRMLPHRACFAIVRSGGLQDCCMRIQGRKERRSSIVFLGTLNILILGALGIPQGP